MGWSAGGFAANRQDHVQAEGGMTVRSVRAFAANGWDYVHPEGGIQWTRGGQQGVAADQISRTSWRWKIATRWSGSIPVNIPNHVHPKDGKWPWYGQQRVLQQKDKITYKLMMGNIRQMAVRGLISKQVRSRTIWGWKMTARWSVRVLAAKEPYSIHPEGGKWPRDS
jgi:hypothetical protein